MRNVDIEVFNIGKTQVNREEVKRWLDYLKIDEFELPGSEVISDPALLVALAGKRCYMSFKEGANPNVTKIRKEWDKYLDNILASGHGSVTEHSVYNWAIEGVSRVFTAEMNRHRAGWAISEGSLRYIRFSVERDEAGQPKPNTGIPWWLPTSLEPQDGDTLAIMEKKAETRSLFRQAFEHQEGIYEKLLTLWNLDQEGKLFAEKKKLTSLFRRIVGLGVATGGVWSGNLRALRHVITMRASPEAEEEICHVFCKVAKRMLEMEPYFFKDFTETPEGFWVPKYRKV